VLNPVLEVLLRAFLVRVEAVGDEEDVGGRVLQHVVLDKVREEAAIGHFPLQVALLLSLYAFLVNHNDVDGDICRHLHNRTGDFTDGHRAGEDVTLMA